MIDRACALLCQIVTGVQARADQDLSRSEQRVYFANHSSNLDFPVIWSSLPLERRRETRPVAAADYWERTKVRRYFANDVFRAVLINRSGAGRLGAFNKMLAALNEGSSLIIFPEGTRTPGHEINDFKSGLYVLAREYPTIQFVPTYLENLNRILPKGEKLLVPLICRLRFGAPLFFEPAEEKSSFLRRAKVALEALRP